MNRETSNLKESCRSSSLINDTISIFVSLFSVYSHCGKASFDCVYYHCNRKQEWHWYSYKNIESDGVSLMQLFTKCLSSVQHVPSILSQSCILPQNWLVMFNRLVSVISACDFTSKSFNNLFHQKGRT